MESANSMNRKASPPRKRAGRLFLYVLLTSIALGVQQSAVAQSFSEWFKQKKTQKKYLLEQISALFTYARYVRDGYGIAERGLGTISGLTRGELNLHDAFFSALKTVAPMVRHHTKIPEILALQLAMNNRLAAAGKNGNLTRDDREYIAAVRKQLLAECGKDLDELLLLVMAGGVEMKDEERLARLNAVYGRTMDKWSFLNQWLGEVGTVVAIKEREQQSLKLIKELYGTD